LRRSRCAVAQQGCGECEQDDCEQDRAAGVATGDGDGDEPADEGQGRGPADGIGFPLDVRTAVILG